MSGRPGPDPWEDGRDYADRLLEEDRDAARSATRAERNMMLNGVQLARTPTETIDRMRRLHAHRARYPWVPEVTLHYAPPVGLHPDARAWLAAWSLRWALDELSMREAV